MLNWFRLAIVFYRLRIPTNSVYLSVAAATCKHASLFFDTYIFNILFEILNISYYYL
jgi:hypothetical protein